MEGFYFALYGIICGILCGKLAKRKNRNSEDWFLTGFIFGVFALAALLLLLANRRVNNAGFSNPR